MKGTFTVAGARVRTSSNSRYVCWAVRRKFDGVRYTDEIASREIFARSGSVDTIRRRISRHGWHQGTRYVVIDTVTGDEIVGI